MNDKIVLICATGRSGSTTLQRLLNTIPESNICGENAGAINALLEFYRRLKLSSSEKIPGRMRPASYESLVQNKVKPAWYNSYNYANMVNMIKCTILNMFKNKESTTLWGFKEIRYDAGNIRYLKDFKELFPQTKVIVHVRENIQSQSQSGWFKKDPKAMTFLSKTTKELLDFALANREWCYLSSFERMFDRNHLQNVFQFIGCREKYDEGKISEVLANNIKD
jgi:hypothetical protein